MMRFVARWTFHLGDDRMHRQVAKQEAPAARVVVGQWVRLKPWRRAMGAGVFAQGASAA